MNNFNNFNRKPIDLVLTFFVLGMNIAYAITAFKWTGQNVSWAFTILMQSILVYAFVGSVFHYLDFNPIKWIRDRRSKK